MIINDINITNLNSRNNLIEIILLIKNKINPDLPENNNDNRLTIEV